MPHEMCFSSLPSQYIAAMDAEDIAALPLVSPQSAVEWDDYFDLRWRVLRAPWEQPPGSERDELEGSAIHMALWDRTGQAVAVGRLQVNSPTEGQIRYMAVEPGRHGQGLGSRVLGRLEEEARRLGVDVLVLNAREPAVRFYMNHGYEAAGPAETLYGQIRHLRMMKRLHSTSA